MSSTPVGDVGARSPEPNDPDRVACQPGGDGAETWYPTVSAAGRNSLTVLEFLIESGAPFDCDGMWTSLEVALYRASSEAPAVLIDHGAQIRPLAAAAGLGRLEALDSLLSGNPLHPEAGPIRSPFLVTAQAAVSTGYSVSRQVFWTVSTSAVRTPVWLGRSV